MSKRILFLLIIVTALFLPSLTVQADSGFTVQVEKTNTPVPGEKFTVDVEITGNPGITGLNITLNYDSEIMTLQSASYADFLADDSDVKCSRKGNTVTITSQTPVTRNGVWITLTFKLDAGATLNRDYPIGIRLGNGGVTGEGGVKLSPQLIAGEVNLADHYHEYNKTVTKPTCSSQGYTEYRCTECSVTYISDYVAKKAHTWRNQTTTEATCTRPATLTHECRVCGEVETVETAPMLGHAYIEEIVEPTCSKEGYTLHQCERCDESYQDQIVPTVDHHYTKTYSKEATCAETGYDLYACTFCGVSYQMALPTLEHQWEVQEVKPTHTQGGWSHYTCTNCGLSMRGDFTDPAEYVYVYTTEVEPTCTEAGVRVGVCADGCGHTVREAIPPAEHHYGEWEQLRSATIYRSGLWRAVCTECGDIVESSTPKLIEGEEPVEPDVFTIAFWRGVLDQIINDLTALIVIGVLVFILFLLILIPKIRRAVRRRRDTTLADLEKLANGIQESPVSVSAPENIGDNFCHDYEEFGFPTDPKFPEENQPTADREQRNSEVV